MNDKKFEERITLEVLLAFLDKKSEVSIIDNESPDFVLTDAGAKIGVEIAKVFYHEDNFIGQNANRLKRDIIKILSERGLYQKLIKDPSSIEGCRYQHVKSYQFLLPPFAIQELNDDIRAKITNSFADWLDNGMPENNMFSVHDRYYRYTDVELIYMTCSMPILDGEDLAPITQDHPLHEIIEQKNDLLQRKYVLNNPCITEWWLCLEVTTDSTISACKYSFEKNYPNRFDRVFIVDPNRFRVFEIEKNSDV